MVFLLFVALVVQSPRLSAQDNFGRFFTTPKQREELDMKRFKDPERELSVQIDETDFEDKNDEERPVDLGSVQLKGLVYRSDGKSTARVRPMKVTSATNTWTSSRKISTPIRL